MTNNRFQRATLGLFAEIIIAKSAAITPSTLAAFITSGLAGSIAAFWDDTNIALAAGDTALPANSLRSYYYAWKQADGTYHRTSAIPVLGLKYDSVAYNAGTALVRAITFGGAYALSQILTVRVINTTQNVLPYPSYDYSVVIGAGGINAANTAIAALINAEPFERMVSASAATNVLTVTALDKKNSFKLTTYIETTPSQQTDATAAVLSVVTPQVLPIGDTASVMLMNQYAMENLGNPVYNRGDYTDDEFGMWSSNVDAAINYGFVVVTNKRTETGAVHNFSKKCYCIIAVATAGVAGLAAL